MGFAALLILLVAVAVPVSASAAAGDVRSFFSDDGRVITDVEAGSDDYPEAAAVDAAGRLVVVGRSIKGPLGVRLAVARYLPNGELDPSFGVGGLVVSGAEGGLGANDVVIDPAGRIVVAGRDPTAAAGRSKMARLLPDGRFDPSFGGDGMIALGTELEAKAVALDRAGRIVVAGRNNGGNQRSFLVARLLPDGAPDRSFGATGAILLDLAPDAPDEARDVLVDGFGRVVLAGSASPAGDLVSRYALVRLHEDGRLDLSLRGSGVALIRMNGPGAYGRAMIPHGRGNVVIGGNAKQMVDGQAVPHSGFVKVRGAGKLDKRFGKNGRAGLRVRYNLQPVALANGRDARILTALGDFDVFSEASGPLIAARLHPLGAPDRSFSKDSRATTGFGKWSATAAALATFPNGDLAVAGPARSLGRPDRDFAIVRYAG